MAPEPGTSDAPAVRRAVDKVRLTVRKDGSLRWLSHHDLLRTFERMLRRADLPVHHTNGFHPHPRLVFALSLPLGVIGRAEIVEIELDEAIEPDVVHARLAMQCPPGLHVLQTRRIPVADSARVVGLCYAVQVPPERHADLRNRIAAVLAEAEVWADRVRPPRRRLNIRPFLRDLRLDGDSGWLEMDLHLRPEGTARPDEVLTALGLEGLTDAGAVLERARLDLQDENTPDPIPGGPA